MEKNFKIIYEDDNIIGVIKPYGMLSTADNKESLESLLVKYRRDKGEMEYIGTVHRLDRTTQGLMIYSKTPKMTTLLNEIIKKGEFSKEYLGVFEGIFDNKSDTLEDLLFYDKQKNKSFVVKKERKGVKKALLSYEVIKEKDNLSLLSIKLKTGRTHQIRVQFASRRFPLVGDRRYGSKINANNIMLCSRRITFVNPIDNKTIDLTYEPVNEFFGEMK